MIFTGIVIGIGGSVFIQKLCFGFGGDNLTHIIRVKLFEAILRKHVGWFDDKSKASGVLSNMLTEEINDVNGLTSEAIGTIIEAGLGLVLSCAFCFYFSP